MFNLFVSWEICPCRVNSKLLVFATAIYCGIVHVDDIFALLAVRFDDSLLHLLYSEVNRDDFCDAEECRLEDCVSAVAQTNLLRNLCGVDVVYCDVLLSKVLLHIVWKEVDQIFTIEDCVEKELAILTKAAEDIIHAQVSLDVACNEVWSLNLIC